MKAMVRALVATMLLVGPTVRWAAGAGERMVCPVCRVKEGPREPEDVKAWRTHEGVRYGLCSEKCAREFVADPIAYLPPRFPRPAPELAISSLEGGPLSWEGLRGKVVLVDFWATWCAPCRRSMPELQTLHDRYRARGFMVLGVSIDEAKSVGKVKRFLSSRRITYPVAIDSEPAPAWDRFRVKAVPAAFLVDQQGRVVAQWTGQPVDIEELDQKLGALLEGAEQR